MQDWTGIPVGRMVRDHGLEITLFQPFRDFEGMPEPHRSRAFDRAERKFDLMQELGAELMLVCSNVSEQAIDDERSPMGEQHHAKFPQEVIDEYATRMPVFEVSIGDYVLAGGEAAVLVVTEAVARLLPGVLGNAESHRDDSFAPGAMANLLEGPVYTKPPEWRGHGIPDVLLSGHHGKIARWRRDEALRRTTRNRPDLIERCDPAAFDKKDREMLSILGWRPGPDGRFGRDPEAVEE